MTSMKSKPTHYGTVAISIHWLSALFILIVAGAGFMAADSANHATKAELLRLHIVVAVFLISLTIFRIIWWWRFDKKPTPLTESSIQSKLGSFVHFSFYIIILGMTASGIGMLMLSEAGPVIFSSSEDLLPNFNEFLPRRPHGLGARILVALIILHIGAALYHQFIQKDGLLRRMWWRS